ncbi:Ig-like domain-containing protein [Bradymonas sediminis]|uniref:Uncharacterized protein n=1 Tax=Bradymonas sediminis TaxID=1548548 RepID=A0A2Z4FHP8_9DELT|nr:Ig-like domain-containing protein [Bradymonas sediminis]AWV88238.1 hypothetical protein DN745_02335 [Bradymonas sediminis]TDP77360.1 Ig-like domain-containing protein [Bradymonas sediminis]
MHAPHLSRARRPRWSTKITRYAGVFLALSLLTSACADDDATADDGAQCSIDNPCPETQSCLQGVCIAREISQCTYDSDCPGGDYRCIDQTCKLPTPDAGTNPNNSSDTTGNNTLPDTTPGDAPRVISTSPANGDSDVALDTQLTIKFNEPMDPVSMNFYSLVFRDANNMSLDADIEYDAETYTTTLSPIEPLKPAEGYTLEIRSGVRNMGMVGVNPKVTVAFSTAYEEPAKHATLARTWAPLIYQGIDLNEGVTPNEQGDNIVNPTRPDADIPTRIDFDGNRSAVDNQSNSMRAATPINASIYYSVTESTSYYFLHYFLYYPSRYGVDTRAEHDFAGLLVVVDKATDKMLMTENVSLAAARELTNGFKPEGSPARVPGGDLGDRSMSTFPLSQLEDGTHFPLYVPAGSHEACHWYQTGRDGFCLHASAQFPGPSTGAAPGAARPTSGVVLRPGDTGQTFEQATKNADTGFWEMRYELLPIPSSLWTLRGNYDTDGLFELPFSYRPEGTDRPTGVGPDEVLMLPKNLQSNATDANGRLPFSWLATPGKRNQGQWLLDPVYIVENRYVLGASPSADYCYNFFLNIDNRASSAHPGCQD